MDITGKSKVDAKTGESEWGFKVPETGTYAFIFDEGIEIHKKEDAEKVTESLMFPGHIIENDEYADTKQTIYAAVGKDSGERRIADILVCTELAEAFEKKFTGDMSMFDPTFIRGLQTRLPGKTIFLSGEKVVGKKGTKYEGKENFNITKIGKYRKGGAPGPKLGTETPGAGTSAAKPANPVTAPVKAEDDGEGW